MELMDAKKALDKAKVQIMAQRDSTFITTICFSLIHKFCDSIPTAATNGKIVKYNPEFFMKLTPAEQLGLVLHETWHVVFDHMGRVGTRSHTRYNKAADYVINNMLDDRGIHLPAGGLIDHKYDGMHTDQIYDLLPDDPSFVGDLEAPEGDLSQHKAKIDDMIIQASLKAAMAGDKPGSIPGVSKYESMSSLPPNFVGIVYWLSFSTADRKMISASVEPTDVSYLTSFYLVHIQKPSVK